jgi:tRNA (guanine37-N1)-methyltransferase
VHEVSIGDYVLGGGEVASLVMIEAITRLIPGVLGNPESLTEESHNEEGYLEYPNFTKPSTWRDIDVPAILLSGNHGEIAKWRAVQAQERAKKNL